MENRTNEDAGSQRELIALLEEQQLINEKLVRANRVYAVTSRINQMIARVKDRDTLFREACSIAVKQGGFRMVWIGLTDYLEQIVKPVAFDGYEKGYLEKIRKISTLDIQTGRGPTGTATRKDKPEVSNDIANDPNMAPWRHEALKRNYRSSISLPITLHLKVIGTFNLYSSDPNSFDEHEVSLLTDLTRNITYALEMMENEQQRIGAEERLRKSLERNKILLELYEQSHHLTDRERYDFVLREAIRLTDSTAGFFHLVSEDQERITFSIWINGDNTKEDSSGSLCDPDPGRSNQLRFFLVRKPVVCNDFHASDEKYLPVGDHVQIHRYQSIPVLDDDILRMVIGVANKSTDYTDDDLVQTQLVANALASIQKQRRAEDALRLSEEKFSTIFGFSSTAYTLYDTEAKLIDVNPAFLRMTGYTREEAIGKSTVELNLISPVDQKRLLANTDTDGTLPGFEMDMVRKDGSICPIMLSRKRIFLGEKPYGLGIAIDITELRQTETRLVHSHSLMRYIIDHNRSSVAVHDRNLRYIYVSQRYLDEYNVKDRNIIGKHHYDVFPDLPQKWRDVHKRVLAGEVLNADNDSYERADGSVEWTRWECRPWYEASGSIGGIIVYTEIVTERRRAEEALKESERKYRIVADNTYDWEFWVNQDGKFLYSSPSCQRITGHDASDFMADQEFLNRIIHPDDRSRYRDHSEEVWKLRDTSEINFRIILPDGNEKWIGHTCVPVIDEEGNMVGRRGSNRDITQQKMHEDIMAARLALAEFSLSHSLEELFEETLNHCEKLTGSFFGAYYLVDDDQMTLKLEGISSRAKAKFSVKNGLSMPTGARQAGIWGDCLKRRTPVVQNLYDGLKNPIKEPEGHPKITRTLLVPIVRGEWVKAVLGMANKATNYTDRDIETISLLANMVWDITEQLRAESALAANARLLQEMMDNSSALIYMLDTEGRFLLINREFERVFGCSRKDVLGQRREKVIPSGLAERSYAHDQTVITSRTQVTYEEIAEEDDGIHYYLTTKFPLINSRQELYSIAGISTDITAMKQLQVALEDNETRFRTMSENSLTGISIVSGGRIHYVNPSFCRMFGYNREELIDADPVMIAAPRDRARMAENIRRLEAGEVRTLQYEFYGIRKKGKQNQLLALSAVAEISGRRILLSNFLDITEDRLTENKLKKYAAQLQGLTAYHENLREEERATLARDLHDILGASLTGLKMELVFLQQTLQEHYPEPNPHIDERIQVLTEMIDSTVGLTRRLVRELRPGMIEELGLPETIRWYTREMEGRSGIRFNCVIFPKDFRVNLNQSVILFRVFQEIITNIIRHSEARNASILLHKKTRTLTLRVSDDGIGITPENMERKDSFGLLGMKERVLLLKGKIKISGKPGKGTTVVVEAPLKRLEK